MLKTIRRIFTTLVVLTILVLAYLYYYSNSHTYLNKEEEIGNSAGNIYNGGLFCEQDGKIYFSNDKADGALGVMNSDCTGYKKLSDNKAVFINADENYIYYINANDTKENNKAGSLMFNNSGVFRINQNGSEFKVISDKPSSYLILKGNNIFFQRYDVDAGFNLYEYKIDGTMEHQLKKDAVIPAAVIGTSLYYTGSSNDQNIHTIGLDSFTTHTALQGSYYNPIYMGNYIYYLNPADNKKIYRVNQDGSQPEKLVNSSCSTYNITNSGKFLYYIVANTKKKGIYRQDLKTKKVELVLAGDLKQINVTDNYVFFKDLNNTNTYRIDADGFIDVKLFDTTASTK